VSPFLTTVDGTIPLFKFFFGSLPFPGEQSTFPLQRALKFTTSTLSSLAPLFADRYKDSWTFERGAGVLFPFPVFFSRIFPLPRALGALSFPGHFERHRPFLLPPFRWPFTRSRMLLLHVQSLFSSQLGKVSLPSFMKTFSFPPFFLFPLSPPFCVFFPGFSFSQAYFPF